MPKRGTDPETVTEDKPAEAVTTTRVQLHSPLQAAAILARLAGLDSSWVSLGKL